MDKPLSGPWRSILELLVKYHCLVICYNDGYRVTHTFKDIDQVDYSKYLGPDWRTKTSTKPATVWVSNHVGVVDTFVQLTSG